jgi:hypothetical protein
MFEEDVLERDELASVESPQSVPASHDPDEKSDAQGASARAPLPKESPAAKGACLTRSPGHRSAAGDRQRARGGLPASPSRCFRCRRRASRREPGWRLSLSGLHRAL